MGKRNQAEPDAGKNRVTGNQGPAKSGKKPDAAADKPASRKPAEKKAAPAKPAAAKKTTPGKSAAKPASAAKRPAAAKSAAASRASAANPEKKTPARRAAPPTQPPGPETLAEARSGFLPGAPPDAPPTNLPPVNIPPVPGYQPPVASGGPSRVVLMIRDPEWLYGYWEISETDRTVHAIGQPQGAPPLLLRVHDQGEGAEPAPTGEFFDVTVIPDASGWYIRVPEGGGHWSAALGYLDYEGSFVTLAQSNVVTTPRPLHGEWNEQTWGPVSPEAELAQGAGAGPVTEEYGPNGQSRLVRRASRLMAYMRGLGASEQALRPGASEQLLRPGASEQFLRPGASEQLRPGASEQVPYFGASEQVPFFGASERFGASEQAARQPGGVAVLEKTFWLQVHTELIVYGATEPDAKVTVQGVPIQLRPDGTFTLRFALPDGEQVIPVHAVNADGDMERTITPIVKKRTV